MTARRSFLDRISRYPVGANNPRENRTTEILAAVCEQVDGLALHLAHRWLDPAAGAGSEVPAPTHAAYGALLELGPDAPVLVRTQVPAPGRFVDLELRFLTGERPAQIAALVWVEVKHGTDPHTGQVPAYMQARAPYPGAVVLLAPRDDLPAGDPEQVPADVPQRSWQATARSIASFKPTDPVSQWLIEQLTDYLLEEGLMDPIAIGPEHLTALAYERQAHEALEVITQIAAAHTNTHYRHHTTDETARNRSAGVGYWQAWDAPEGPEGAEAWNGAYFDWNLAYSHGTPFPSGAVFVMAGLTKAKGSEFADPTGDWHQALNRGLAGADGPITFERWTARDVERLQRAALPQDVLRGRTLEEQGESLGRWIVETFRALERHGPPLVR